MAVPVSKQQPSLEGLIERVDLGLEVLHPGGSRITDELAELCGIGEDTRVLDVASGTGESACHLAEKFRASVVGVELSVSMIGRARAKAVKRSLPVKFLNGDAENLPLRDKEFDVAISECTVCLLDKRRVIGEMARVVRAGGYVGIHDLCWRADTPERLKRELARIEGERPETLAGWKALFEGSGLVDVRVVDKSDLIPGWVKGLRRQLGLYGQLRIFLYVARKWGLRGLGDVLKSERIFGSPHTGYGIVVGRKPVGG